MPKRSYRVVLHSSVRRSICFPSSVLLAPVMCCLFQQTAGSHVWIGPWRWAEFVFPPYPSDSCMKMVSCPRELSHITASPCKRNLCSITTEYNEPPWFRMVTLPMDATRGGI